MTRSARNPAMDTVAIANAATTGFVAANTERSPGSLAVEAGLKVLRDTGLSAADVDGICGSAVPSAAWMQAALGIPEVTWFANPVIPIGNHLAAAVAAVHSGLCETVLVYHAAYRMAWNTASALKDPFRRTLTPGPPVGGPVPESIAGAVGYTAWASRYVHEHGTTREQLALVALNGRANARRNPAAAVREPLTMEDYLGARMIRWPLCLYDMDVPVDGADAFVVTTAERALDLPHPPVLVHAVTLGMLAKNDENQQPSLLDSGQRVVVDALKARSDLWIDDVDVYFPYDGFSIITLSWIEQAGWCGPGEAAGFLAQHWDAASGRVLIGGRVPINPHGGALSEGGTQGSGHLREAVHQLQGRAGERQVAGARTALVTPGGFFFNAQGMVLRRG
jgi:acetyl-CoA acetyltransferase